MRVGASGLEAIASRLEAIASRLEAILGSFSELRPLQASGLPPRLGFRRLDDSVEASDAGPRRLRRRPAPLAESWAAQGQPTAGKTQDAG